MSFETQPKKRPPVPWAVFPALAGVAFIITALVNGPGMVYAVIAVVMGACWAINGAFMHHRD